jgi:hypothetical protein
MLEDSGASIGDDGKKCVTRIKRDLEPFIAVTTSYKEKIPIRRAGPSFRETWKEKYVPQHLCLGLYQVSSVEANNSKSAMNKFRLAVVGAFLADLKLTINDWDQICERIVKDPKKMLEKYDEEGLDHISEEDVQSVLSLDAIFLAWYRLISASYFTSTLWTQFPSIARNLVGGKHYFSRCFYDLFHLENQVPLETIRNAVLFIFQTSEAKLRGEELELTSDSDNFSHDIEAATQANVAFDILCAHTANVRAEALPGFSVSESKIVTKVNYRDNCEHLLHCVYVHLTSTRSDKNEVRTRRGRQATADSAHESNQSSGSLATASQLHKAGINFQGGAGRLNSRPLLMNKRTEEVVSC